MALLVVIVKDVVLFRKYKFNLISPLPKISRRLTLDDYNFFPQLF